MPVVGTLRLAPVDVLPAVIAALPPSPWKSTCEIGCCASAWATVRPEAQSLLNENELSGIVYAVAAWAVGASATFPTMWSARGSLAGWRSRKPAKTPLALPIFMIKAAKLNPEHLQMYRLEIKDGHRDMTAAGRQKQDVIHVRVVALGSGLYRMEVADDLESGQYVLSLDGGDEGFCFEID